MDKLLVARVTRWFLLLNLVVGMGRLAGASASQVKDLTTLTLEELMAIPVVTASQRTEPLHRAASPIYVLGADDIRRSAATSLPDLLRLVPGVQVAQQNGRTWAISTRGFNQTTANKLEVVIDGRSAYTPFFSGTFWDVEDTFLPDIQQIEVVRGPGGTLWGSNAVNGVINVITAPTENTLGTKLHAGAGTRENGFVGLRHGFVVTERTSARVFARYLNRDWPLLATAVQPQADREFWQTGFRTDSTLSRGTVITTQGNAYSDQFGFVDRIGTEVEGLNLMGKLHRDEGDGRSYEFQTHWSYTYRDIPFIFVERRNTGEIGYRQTIPVGDRHGLLWGLQARGSNDLSKNVGLQVLRPAEETLWLFTVYAEDRIEVIADRLIAAVGARVEHHTYTGWEFQPSARIAWHVTPETTVWGSVARAVRIPVRIDADLVSPPAGVPVLLGNRNLDTEKVLSYQVGLRTEWSSTVSADITAHLNRYRDLRSTERQTPGSVTRTFRNGTTGDTGGVEVVLRLRPHRRAGVNIGYTWFDKEITRQPTALDLPGSEGNDAKHVGFAHLALNLLRGLHFDFYARGVSQLPTPVVPGYVTCDARLGWWVTPQVELSVVGRDLADRRHPEFGTGPRREEVRRSIFAELRADF